MIYLAYGSNMSSSILLDRCPGARSLGAARLDGHRLAFTLPSLRWGGHAADVEVHAESSLWGVLWEVSDEDLFNLDQVEARYDRYGVIAVKGNTPTTALTYRAKPHLTVPDGGRPHHDYLHHLISGAREHGLPDRYVRRLGKWSTASRGDAVPGPSRASAPSP